MIGLFSFSLNTSIFSSMFNFLLLSATCIVSIFSVVCARCVVIFYYVCCVIKSLLSCMKDCMCSEYLCIIVLPVCPIYLISHV